MEKVFGLVSGGKCLPLRSLAIEGDVKGYALGLSVRLIYENSTSGPVEVVFKMPVEESQVVVGLSAVIDGRRIRADIKEKEEARVTYDDAIASGLPAALGEETTKDILSIALGNLSGGSKAEIELKLVSQLPMDAEKKLSFSLPTVLKARYTPPSDVATTAAAAPFGGVGADVTGALDGVHQFLLRVHYASSIAAITSDTHSIHVEDVMENDLKIVTLTDLAKLRSDLVIQIASKTPCSPVAIAERGKGQPPSFMSDHVIMVNFLPEIPHTDSSQCEFVFLVDRSGSMSGSFIKSASETLILFLKSLPEGCYFNIYGFGSRYVHLYANSVQYKQQTLERAIEHVQSLKADLGGTEILPPLRHIYSQPLIKGYSRHIFILTDGSVSNTSACIDEVKQNVNIAKCFTFGIGSGASSALVEGMAAAGKGTAEFVKEGERLQPKVIRSLKHALQPALTDVTVKFDLPKGLHVVQVPQSTPTVYDGERLVIYGIVKNGENLSGPLEGTVTLSGLIEKVPISHTVPFGEVQSGDSSEYIHHLAAKCWLMELEKEKDKADIIKLSVEASVLSSETAFVAVDEETSKPVNEPLTSYNISSHFVEEDSQLLGCSIDQAITRGDCLDSLEMKTNSLSQEAYMFQKSAIRAKKKGGGFLSGIGSALSNAFSFGGSPRNSSTRSGVPQAVKNVKREGLHRRGSYEKEREERGETPSPDELESDSYASEEENLASLEEDLLPMSAAPVVPSPSSQVNDLSSIILLQQANGSWVLSEAVASFVGSSLAELQKSCPSECTSSDVWATVLIVVVLRKRFTAQQDEWELVVKKAEGWLKTQSDKIDSFYDIAKQYVKL